AQETLFNPNVVKVIFGEDHHALYFSRQAIPFLRGVEKNQWTNNHSFYKHIGMYGYKSGVLKQIMKLAPGKLEQAESLEQLRWLENGLSIHTQVTEYESVGIDTPEDLQKLTNIF
ncbi:MAG: 3-deoxy-manno-octulosonate cytidylyltransferase, partial [Bacteroidales bacterium]